MPHTTQTSDFWGWYLRHNNRVVWKYMSDAGMDVFAAGPSNNTQAFLDLTNVCPAINGGFNRRWGLSTAITPSTTSTAPTNALITRVFPYNYPQLSSDVVNTANTNLWIMTNDQYFAVYNDSGSLFTGYKPTNFSTSGGYTSACTSRGWFYYGNNIDAPCKVNPSYTTKNTNSLVGIAIPSSAPGSTNYQNYPCVLLPAGVSGTIVNGILALLNRGGGFYAGQVLPLLGGSGTNLDIQIDTVFSGSGPGSITYSNAIGAFHVLSWGSGYTVFDMLTTPSGSPPATFELVQVPSSGLGGTGTGGSGLGYGANTSFTLNVEDVSGGTGHGGQVICYTDSNGAIVKVAVSVPGANYTQGYVTVPAPPAGGTQGYVTVYTQVNTNAYGPGTIVGADVAGPMSFVRGRQWTVALQNSLTGHTSDVWIQDVPYGPTSGTVFDTLTSGLIQAVDATLGDIPVYISSADQTAGFTQIDLTISIPAANIDPQVDTVVLLASSDGGGLGTLYQVNIYPLSTFTLAGGFYKLQVYDNLPDSWNNSNNTYNITNTLLEADLWAYTDPSGNSFGILLNTPPIANGFLYVVQHQGRLFATDGQTVFYSKSLEEVTTATGLITSKWEECWPGDYQLPVALNNERIIGLKSDGVNLHIGTDKSIFTVYGSGPSDFSVPSMAFAQTGILSNDAWTVIYAEGMPAGFVWITQDFKVMHSDFSTYREIGTPVYPIFQTLDPAKVNVHKIAALTEGPYNFVFFELYLTSQTAPIFMLWESRLQKWYRWELTLGSGAGFTISACFVYQFPSYTAAPDFTPGSKYLFFPQLQASGNLFGVNYFNPVQSYDYTSTTSIPWNIQTSWQDCGDSTAIKTINEIEVIAADTPVTVTLYGASSQLDFNNGGTVLKTGNTQTGPISSLGSKKFYCAGANTTAKYYSIALSSSNGPIVPQAITSFSLEFYPMARI